MGLFLLYTGEVLHKLEIRSLYSIVYQRTQSGCSKPVTAILNLF